MYTSYGRMHQHDPAWWRWLANRVPLLDIATPLLRRLAMLALCLALSRIGNVIFLPGLNLEAVGAALSSGAAPAVLQDDLQGELLGIASPLSIYYLGIGPYIDASWTISLIMLSKTPAGINRHLQSLRRAGREGASMLKVYTQIGAVAYAVILGAKRAIELRAFAGRQVGFVTTTMLHLVAGASLLRFAVDQNEAQGLGDGISLLICAGIGARYANMLQALPGVLAAAQVPAWRLIPAAAGCVALVFAATFITRVEKRLPLVYYKKRRKVEEEAPSSSVLPPEPQRAPDYLPMRITPSGTGSLLMASFVFHMIPAALGWLSPALAFAFTKYMFAPAALPWSFGAFVFLMSLLDLSGGSNAQEFADWLGGVDAGVKGISPGPFTEEFMIAQQRTLRIVGGLSMAGLAIAAQLFDSVCVSQIGFSLNSISLILMSGFITTAHRQAQALLQIPRLARVLQQEREALKPSNIDA
ncbi:g6276 [Coccomyxa viridis]|uniref:G6276 protein n=1 Tax=Coccomyxa viridis TaxID=1274662 RepID=A0ABP1FWA2_9CHLO